MISVSAYYGNVMDGKTAEMDQMKKIVQVASFNVSIDFYLNI